MDKLEKVIKGFDICKNLDGSCDGCPYFDNELGENSCMREHLMPDAIELLKEHKEHEDLLTILGYHWTGSGETLALCKKSKDGDGE